jgi:hypothetical protein
MSIVLNGTTGITDANGGTVINTVTAVFTKQYTSSNQTITAAGLLTLAHSMGVSPRLVYMEIICTVADAGYSIGDVVMAELNNSTSVTTRQNSLYYDATNIYFRFDPTTPFCTSNKSTGVATGLTNTSWVLKIRAFA